MKKVISLVVLASVLFFSCGSDCSELQNRVDLQSETLIKQAYTIDSLSLRVSGLEMENQGLDHIIAEINGGQDCLTSFEEAYESANAQLAGGKAFVEKLQKELDECKTSTGTQKLDSVQ